VETPVQKLLARAGLLTIAEVSGHGKPEVSDRKDRPLYIYKGLSSLLSADSTAHDNPGTAVWWSCALKVIGVTRDSKFGEEGGFCQSRMKIPHFAGRKFPTLEPYKAASLASDAVEPSAVFWRVLGATESEAKELDAARSCSRAGTSPALRRSFIL